MEKLSQREAEFILHVETLREILSEPNSIRAQQLFTMIHYNMICDEPPFPEIQVGLLYFCGLNQIPFEYFDSIYYIFNLLDTSLVSSLDERTKLKEVMKQLNITRSQAGHYLAIFNHWLEGRNELEKFDLNKRLLEYLEIEKQVPNYRPDVPIDIQLRGENDIQIYYRLRRLKKEGIDIFETLRYKRDTLIGYFVLIAWYELYSNEAKLSFRSIEIICNANENEFYKCLVAALDELLIEIVPAKWD